MPDSARQSTDDAPARPRVGLLVTCLVDLFRPAVGFAAVRLLEDAGCVVDVPAVQTCCGQPRRLLASAGGLTMAEMRDSDACCGFGGTFCVKYPEISTRLVDEKCANVLATGTGLSLPR